MKNALARVGFGNADKIGSSASLRFVIGMAQQDIDWLESMLAGEWDIY